MPQPVLAGIARRTQRVDEPGGGFDAVDLMCEVVEAALADAGGGLGPRVQQISIPRGMWRATDPARVVAQRIGAPDARTISAEVGVLQHTLVNGTCDAIARGEIDVAIVCGGEARYRHVLAGRAGVEVREHPAGAEPPPDETLRPASPIVTSYEFERGIVMAPIQYAMIESAYAHAKGWSRSDHFERLGELWSSNAGASDEHAWDRTTPDAAAIVTPSPDNRMVASPYTRLLCSQWNVDQAAALVLVSADVARSISLDPDRFVFPVAGVESNAMIPMFERTIVHRWPAFEHASRVVLELAGVSIDDIGLLDIYSCFPSAVQVQLDALGIAGRRPVSVTGGMTFGGGPLNNYVLQATVAIAERLREERGHALVTGISGLLTKPGLTIWSSAPPRDGFRSADVSDAAVRDTARLPIATHEHGTATVVASTVVHDRGSPPRAAAVVGFEDGSRTVASSVEAADVEAFSTSDMVGAAVTVTAPGVFRT